MGRAFWHLLVNTVDRSVLAAVMWSDAAITVATCLSLMCLFIVFVGQSRLTGGGVRAFTRAMMMSAVVIVHYRLQITACGVSFSCYSSQNFICFLRLFFAHYIFIYSARKKYIYMFKT